MTKWFDETKTKTIKSIRCEAIRDDIIWWSTILLPDQWENSSLLCGTYAIFLSLSSFCFLRDRFVSYLRFRVVYASNTWFGAKRQDSEHNNGTFNIMWRCPECLRALYRPIVSPSAHNGNSCGNMCAFIPVKDGILQEADRINSRISLGKVRRRASKCFRGRVQMHSQAVICGLALLKEDWMAWKIPG